jgi:NitT/TauT family transport system permease protein
MRRLIDIAAPLMLVTVLLGLWEAACNLMAIPTYFLPKPSEVWAALIERWPVLLGSAWNTLLMAIAALAVASVCACALGLAAALSRTFERSVRPLAVTLQVTPIVALAPLVTIWAGLDHATAAVVGLAAVVAFFPIFSGALTGLKSADPDLKRLFDLYGATPWQRLVKLDLPSATPFLLEGHKVAVGLAIIGAVVAEFVAGSGQTKGLAWRILEAQNRLRIADMLAAVLVLGLLAVGLNALFAVLERQANQRWRGRPR